MPSTIFLLTGLLCGICNLAMSSVLQPPTGLGCNIDLGELDLSTPEGVAAMEKMKEELQAWRDR